MQFYVDLFACCLRCTSRLRFGTPTRLVNFDPGVLLPPEAAHWIAAHFINSVTRFGGAGLHFMKMEQPTTIERIISGWLATLPAGSSLAAPSHKAVPRFTSRLESETYTSFGTALIVAEVITLLAVGLEIMCTCATQEFAHGFASNRSLVQKSRLCCASNAARRSKLNPAPTT
ncbi:hypothetical protein [uncultured Tateyamaria sp.]|uniref:hypothetical protein n=1 Tax=uncultured Tateyamaria sp. TaxID=455651 RepID=UPI002611E215|nr:hypothetical protein [uncultured Tateyamaria sp.]